MKVFLAIALIIQFVSANIPQMRDDSQPFKVDDNALVICFIFLSLGIGSIFKEINKRYGIPYTPVLFLVGIAWGYYSDKLGVVGLSCKYISSIDPEGVLIIFLPVLIYESGFNFDWHIFKRLFIQIVILAFPCVVFLSFFLQFTLKVILEYGDDYYTWESAFMFGSILSCTDTVAVLALLKESGASKRFTSLIEGESLLNDGACMVLFTISYGICKGGSANVYQITSLFVSLTFGGTILGLIFGVISVYWIKKIFNDEILVLNITIISCYMVFFVAEHVSFGFRMSGILALVSLGLFMSAFGRTRISHEADRTIHEFWEYVVYAGETVIFILAGILVSLRVLSEDSIITFLDFYKLFGLWACAMAFRFVAILIVMPILKRCGYGLLWKEVIVLSYGGLRGAVGITFSLIVSKDNELPQKLRDIILFQMSGLAILTLIINGTTLSFLIKILGLSTQSLVREKIFAGFLQKLDDEIENECKKNFDGKYLVMADWEEVKKLSGQQVFKSKGESIQKKIGSKEKKLQDVRLKNMKMAINDMDGDLEQELIEEDEQDNDIDLDLLTEVRRIFLMTLKGIYWELFDKNQCSPDALIILTQSANLDLDNDKEHMNSWEFLNSQFSEKYINSLFYMKDWWIVGRFSRNFLFSYIFYIYDVVSSYIESLDLLKEEAKLYNFSQALKHEMLNEVEDNRKSAVQYIDHYLQVSFPEISRELHTKKASFQILEFEISVLKSNLQSGQLEEKEYMMMKKSIDQKVVILNNMNPSWEMKDLFEVLQTNELLKGLPETTLKKLIAESREESFGRDQIIYKEGDRLNEAFIILRGGGSEHSDTHKIREKRMIDDVTPIYMIVAPSIRYHTTFTTDCVIHATFFKVSALQQIMKSNPSFEEQVWKYSIPLLSKIYAEELKPLCFFNKAQVKDVANNSTFLRVKKNQLVKIDQGAILLKGGLIEARDSIAEIQEEQEEEEFPLEQTKTQQVQDQGWKREPIVLIGPQSMPLRSTSNSLLLVFKQWSQLQIINNVDPSAGGAANKRFSHGSKLSSMQKK